MSVGGFRPYRQVGSYSRRKQVLTYSVLVEFGLFLVLGDQIYEMRCLFVAVGLNARFIVALYHVPGQNDTVFIDFDQNPDRANRCYLVHFCIFFHIS